MNEARLLLLQHLTQFRADDLIPEENDTVQLALKRLPPKEAYDRVFRLRRAFQVKSPALENVVSTCSRGFLQCSIAHQLLPANEQTPPEDVRTHSNSTISTS